MDQGLPHSDVARFDVRSWWEGSEHKESEIDEMTAMYPGVGTYVEQQRALASAAQQPRPLTTHHEEATSTAHVESTVPSPSLRAERRAYRASTQVPVRRTLLAATRYDGRVAAHALGNMTEQCTACGALMWMEERKPGSSKRNPSFDLCCKNGDVVLPLYPNPPQRIMDLLQGDSAQALHYRENTRAFNSAFGFTSGGASFDRSLANSRQGVYTYRVQAAVYHLISTGLLPDEGREPCFAQIYIFDTDYQIDRRSAIIRHLDREVLTVIQEELHEVNPYVTQFVANNERSLKGESTQTFELIVGEQPSRQYDQPTESEVAVLLLGDGDSGNGRRDIVLRKRGGALQFVSQLDGKYDPLHFVLLFPFGDLAWSIELKRRTGVTMNQFHCYHLMVREACRVLQLSGRLTQEYTVDAYAKIEESRLIRVRYNQPQLRANLYQGLLDQVGEDDVAPPGRMVILPPSFTGGPRYMQSLYPDAMTIVRKLGKPDLFITMTCNPKWKEITDALLAGQKAQDRFDLCCRVFKMKVKALLHLIIDKEVLKGRVYVVEFQKRGLAHAHMLWILHDEYKPKTPEDIDRIVCAELPDPADQVLFDCVTSNMIHGPCGAAKPSAPCTKDEVCTKKYPEVVVTATQISSDGYPLYRRREDGRIIVKGRRVLDNRYVVP